jgi:hypothetical protein
MSAPAKTDDRITATERRELRTVVRMRLKVLRSEVAAREADLTQEMERRLVERYRGDDEQNTAFRNDVKKIQARANEQLVKLKEKYEDRFSGGRWNTGDDFSMPYCRRSTEDRQQLRRALEAGIKAELRAAKVALDRQEADLLENLSLDALQTSAARAFLATLPKAVELVPSQKLQEIEARYDANPREFG